MSPLRQRHGGVGRAPTAKILPIFGWAALASLLVASLVGYVVLRANDALSLSDRYVFLFWTYLPAAGVGVLGAIGWMAVVRRLFPNIAPSDVFAVGLGASALGLGTVRVLIRGIYFSEWGIESPHLALLIRVGQFLLVTVVAVAITAIVRRLVLNRSQLVIGVAITLVALAVPLFSNRRDSEPLGRLESFDRPPRTAIVVLAGFDGMSWTVADRELRNGRMPNLSGQQLYEKVAEERPELLRSFVFATGDLMRRETTDFLGRVPNRILMKPLEVETVRRVLSQALDAS